VTPPVLPQRVKQHPAEHHLAFPESLTVNADDHSLAVDVIDPHTYQLGTARAGGVERHENHPMKRENGGIDQSGNLVLAQHPRWAFLSFRTGSIRCVPETVQRLHKEESQSRQVLIYGVGGQLSISEQMSLEYPNMFRAQFVWRTVENLSEFLNGSNVALARGIGIVSSHEFLDHHCS
jgi:hypothetical protein